MMEVLLRAVCGIAFVLTCSVCWAEKVPLSAEDLEQQSTHIVTGRVINITSKIKESQFEKGEGNQDAVFSIKVIVETISKGSGIKKGDEILVTAWKPHVRVGLAQIGLQGHVPIPRKEQLVTCYLKQVDEVFEPLLPNGMDIKSDEADTETSTAVGDAWKGILDDIAKEVPFSIKKGEVQAPILSIFFDLQWLW